MAVFSASASPTIVFVVALIAALISIPLYWHLYDELLAAYLTGIALLIVVSLYIVIIA